MKKLGLVICMLLCAGCATVTGFIPSIQSCEKVTYTRVGANAHIEAECYVPR